MEQLLLFPIDILKIEKEQLYKPEAYKGIYAFHKYWGKKPVEYFCHLIENFTEEDEIVIDPFLGSGLIARETVIRKRRFIGIDINPFSIELATFFIEQPKYFDIEKVLKHIEKECKNKINESYLLEDNSIASHYLWNNGEIQSAWKKNCKGREELKPTNFDIIKFLEFEDYKTKYIRPLRFFKNSRINANPNFSLLDLFTGRALRNIDILIESFRKFDSRIKRTLLLILTSACGQMSKMVFAVKNRGITKGETNGKIEVGSWVIGYWRPKEHFEINAWNCFEIRAKKLLKFLKDTPQIDIRPSHNIDVTIKENSKLSLITGDSKTILKNIPSESISLIVTDPPHGDRIPYLELSELWNSILGFTSNFEDEIVVSNAIERGKNINKYNADMSSVFSESYRILKDKGIFAIFFNAVDIESWQFLKEARDQNNEILFVGCYPMAYSARSVIQDNRKGAMKNDYILIFQKNKKTDIDYSKFLCLSELPGWSYSFPK